MTATIWYQFEGIAISIVPQSFWPAVRAIVILLQEVLVCMIANHHGQCHLSDAAVWCTTTAEVVLQVTPLLPAATARHGLRMTATFQNNAKSFWVSCGSAALRHAAATCA